MPSDNGIRAVLTRVEKRLDVLTRVLLGNGDVGLAEQVRDNAKVLKKLDARVVSLESDRDFRVRPTEIEKTKQAKLQTAKEWAGVFGAVLAVILAIVNAIVLLGGNG